VSKKKNLQAEAADLLPKVRILAIETATNVSSVALFEDGLLVALQENHANRTHARLVTVMIERLLQDLDLRPTDLSAVAVAKGPGSYTGLRVGVSVAKGLCMALDIPLLSVGSLEALAWSVVDVAQAIEAQICPMIDARRMEVFVQLFDVQGHATSGAEAKIMEEGAFADILATGKVLFVGDGAEKCRALWADNPQALVLGTRLSSAAYMGAIAHRNLLAGEVEDLVTFEPFYLKEFVATLSTKKIL
jgi:tRNA threonylcarbamoyladenosine biosynthesis protein TsaB